jgi:hypothetical protein
MVDHSLHAMGFIRATCQNGDWLFEFPDSQPGAIGWHFLESVTGQIKKLLLSTREKSNSPEDALGRD